MNEIQIFRVVFIGFVAAIFCMPSLALSPQLVPPPYNVSNRHDVNVATGHVQMTHNDVTIGGEMGLSHSISMHNSSWAGNDTIPAGPLDKFSGKLICVNRNAYTGDNRYWLVASDGSGSQFFDPGVGSAAVPDNQGYFPSIGDKRYSLRYEASDNGMVMTKPDGTKIIYGSSIIYPVLNSCVAYDMTEIRRPNGFTIKIKMHTNGQPGSVTTNTGFQLRYYFIPQSTAVDMHAWWDIVPQYVVAFNNAVEYCPHSSSRALDRDCSTMNWPKVQYIWPNHMPTGMLQSGGVFSVINPDGTRTDYTQGKFVHGTSVATRLTKVQRANASVPLEFQYLPYVERADKFGIAFYWPSELGVLQRSWVGEDSISYAINSTMLGLYSGGGGYQGIASIHTNAGVDASGGKILSISAWNYSANFNADGSIKTYGDKLTGVGSSYSYDGRGNIEGITSRGVTQTAEYESECNPFNYKYCNSPKWLKDAKNQTTYYTYHPQSGQVETVTYPPNKEGISAVTRYGYELKYANYYMDSSGVKKKSSSGVWLKSSEKYCIKTATNIASDNCAGGASDEVVIQYEYNSDNLLLSGVSVKSVDQMGMCSMERTYYQYDKYANKIGETKPKASSGSCN